MPRSRSDCPPDASQYARPIVVDFVFPYSHNKPSVFGQKPTDIGVALSVSSYLLFPELYPCLWHAAVRWTSVPKTGIQEYGDLAGREGYVNLVWTIVITKSQALPPKGRPDPNLESGILGSNPRHDPAAFLGNEYVGHESTLVRAWLLRRTNRFISDGRLRGLREATTPSFWMPSMRCLGMEFCTFRSRASCCRGFRSG